MQPVCAFFAVHGKWWVLIEELLACIVKAQKHLAPPDEWHHIWTRALSSSPDCRIAEGRELHSTEFESKDVLRLPAYLLLMRQLTPTLAACLLDLMCEKFCAGLPGNRLCGWHCADLGCRRRPNAAAEGSQRAHPGAGGVVCRADLRQALHFPCQELCWSST